MENQHIRYHGLDALRGIAMLLGIVLHAALPFMVGMPISIWPTDKYSSESINVIFEFIHIWRMPLFFILAGFFAKLVIDRYSWNYWWKNRLRRIGLPLLIFTPIMGASIPWIWTYGWGKNSSYFFTLEGGPWHLWFLFHLIFFVFFSFICISANSVLKRLRLAFIGYLLSYLNIFSWVAKFKIFQSQYPIPLIILLTLIGLWTGFDLIENPILSALFFAFGYGLYKNIKLLDFMKKYWLQYLIVSVFFFVIYLSIYKNIDFLDPSTWETWAIPYSLLKAINAILFSYAFIGLAEAKFGNYSPTLRYISDSSYWIYLIHLPLVAFITFFLFRFPIFVEFKFIIAIVSTTVIGLISYKFLVRSSIIGILLNGKKIT